MAICHSLQRAEEFLTSLLPSQVGTEGQARGALGVMRHRREYFSWWHRGRVLILNMKASPTLQEERHLEGHVMEV